MKKNLIMALSILCLTLTACKGTVNTGSTDENNQDNSTAATYDPDNIVCHIITYTTERGTAPSQIAVADGAKLKDSQLPSISADYFEFKGWYIDSTKVEAGYEVKSDLTLNALWSLTGYEYTWTESSGPISSTISTFSKDGEYTKATETSSSTSIHNLVINYNNMPLKDVYGFEGEIKLNSNITYAGYEWYTNDSSYDMYFFEIYNDGRFVIQTDVDSKWNTLLTLSASESGININDFNTIKVQSLSNCDVEVYLNGNLVYTISKDNLVITPELVARAYCAKSATSSNTGYVWYKFLQFQKIKG